MLPFFHQTVSLHLFIIPVLFSLTLHFSLVFLSLSLLGPHSSLTLESCLILPIPLYFHNTEAVPVLSFSFKCLSYLLPWSLPSSPNFSCTEFPNINLFLLASLYCVWNTKSLGADIITLDKWWQKSSQWEKACWIIRILTGEEVLVLLGTALWRLNKQSEI